MEFRLSELTFLRLSDEQKGEGETEGDQRAISYGINARAAFERSRKAFLPSDAQRTHHEQRRHRHSLSQSV